MPRYSYGGVLLDQAGRVLLVKPADRVYGAGTVAWMWPKGRQEAGESEDATAQREVLEETGWKAGIVSRIPGEFTQVESTVAGYFIMDAIAELQDREADTADIWWVPLDDAADYIGQTRDQRYRERDLSVLAAARKELSLRRPLPAVSGPLWRSQQLRPHGLIDPGQQLQLPPMLNLPNTFYWVRSFPALLAGMRFPHGRGFPWAELHRLGIRHVACLTDDAPAYEPNPVKLLYAQGLEDLYHGNGPRDPARETRLIAEATENICQKLSAGEGVVVHCQGGTGRSGTVIGSVLVRLGFQPEAVLAYLDELHRARGRAGWPESPWQAELIRRLGR